MTANFILQGISSLPVAVSMVTFIIDIHLPLERSGLKLGLVLAMRASVPIIGCSIILSTKAASRSEEYSVPTLPDMFRTEVGREERNASPATHFEYLVSADTPVVAEP